VPAGLEKYSSFWSHTLLGGYGFNSGDHPVLGYLLSAVVGIAVIAVAILAIFAGTRLLRRGRADAEDDDLQGARS
jgi:cobalt/nickel transport system permease protein